MAVNVFMVFFSNANPCSFRKHLWVYCLVCFGAPFIPAVVCLLIRTDKGPVYGDATVSSLPQTVETCALTVGKALVLDRSKLEPPSNIYLLSAHLGLYISIHGDLHGCGVPGFPTA
jgi:hypothetical protein